MDDNNDDSNTPKKPMSAFYYWLEAHHDEYLNKPGSLPALVHTASRVWGQMSESDKAPWVERLEEEKQRYELEVACIQATREMKDLSLKPYLSQAGSSTACLEDDLNAPKKPMSAFYYWLEAHHNEYLNKPGSLPALVHTASRVWGQMSESDKAPWVERLEEEKQRYEREVRYYLAKME